MLPVKAILAAVLAMGLVALWTSGDAVLAAYRTDSADLAAVQLSGIDLDPERAAIEPSPYIIDRATDTSASSTGIAPEPVAVRPSGSPLLTGGSARLSGVVYGPEGPVPGATVRFERDASAGIATAEVTTDDEGQYELQGALGGRFRIRAWVPGTFTMNNSHVRFVNEGEAATVDFTIGPIDPGPHLSFTHREIVYLGGTGAVAASVTRREVGADGLVEVIGIPGTAVVLVPAAGVTAMPTNAITDAVGSAQFLLQCHQVGPASALIRLGDRQGTVALPSCVPVPPPPEPGTEQAEQPDPPAPVQQSVPLTTPAAGG